MTDAMTVYIFLFYLVFQPDANCYSATVQQNETVIKCTHLMNTVIPVTVFQSNY